MSDGQFLALDFGAESGRAMLGTLANERLTLDEIHRFANPNGKWRDSLRWNLLSQWEEIKTALKKTAHLPLAGVGVDTWGVDFGLLADDGEILSNPFMYRDARTDGMIEKAFSIVPKDQIYAQTGVQFMQLDSLFQLLAMQSANSSLLRAAKTLLFMPDLFNYLFTGVARCERSIASTSQMYNPVTQSWALGLLKQLNLPTGILAPVVPSGTVIGLVAPEVCAECGVKPIPVIAPACHDTQSAIAAAPAMGDDWCYISSGTWSLMGVELSKPILGEKALQYNYTNEVGVNDSITFLRNIMGLWPLQQCRVEWLKETADLSYARIAQLAYAAKPFSALINLDHRPILSPGDMPMKIASYCRQTGQNIPSDKGEIARSLFESLALTYRNTLEGLQTLSGKQINVIHIVGGGARNELLNQMTADATGRTVIAGPVEATAIGNILLQALAVGKVQNLPQIRKIIRDSFPVKQFFPQNTQRWDAENEKFKKLPA